MTRLMIIIASIFVSQTLSALPNSVKLSTKLWPPYHYYNNKGDLTGISVKVIECSLLKLGIDLTIEVVPWARAQQHTKLGISDGFFSASWNASRDKYATRSVDIAPQNWVWYTLSEANIDTGTDEFKKHAKVIGTRGSNIVHWLKKNDFNIAAETQDLDNMVNMVLKGRADAFMANELVAQSALSESEELVKLKKTVARSMPVGVYFNHPFLSKHPDFLEAFNQSVEACNDMVKTN